MSLRAPYRVFAILLILSIGGCTTATVADRPMRMTVGQPDQLARMKSYSEQVSGFDRSLTESGKKALISELQNARERAQQARLR